VGFFENHLAGMDAAEIADCFDIDRQAVESILASAVAKVLKATA
jgi:DNA-directed RNA polymerase specialized sigma24 family protein